MIGRTFLLLLSLLCWCWWSSRNQDPISSSWATTTTASSWSSTKSHNRIQRHTQRRLLRYPVTTTTTTTTTAGLPNSSHRQLLLLGEPTIAMDTLKFSFTSWQDMGINEQPSELDYKTAMCQIKYFYTDFLQQGRPEMSFTDVTLQVLEWSMNDNQRAEHPESIIRYMVNATDELGTWIDPVEMNSQLQDRLHFLKRMVEHAWPLGENVFATVKEVQMISTQVLYTDQAQAVLELQNVKFSTSVCPERGYYMANITFGYFPDSASKPTQEEVDDLERQTSTFMTGILNKELPIATTYRMNLTFQAEEWSYDDAQEFPFTVLFQVQGKFLPDGNDVPLNVLKYHLASRLVDGGSLMQDYIQSVAWKVPPEKESSFYHVNRAHLQSRIHKYTDEELKESSLFPDAIGNGSSAFLDSSGEFGSGRPDAWGMHPDSSSIMGADSTQKQNQEKTPRAPRLIHHQV